MDRQVVITGVGVISPIGRSKGVFFDHLVSGVSNITSEEKAFEGHGRGKMSSRVTERDLQFAQKVVDDDSLKPGALMASFAAIEAISDAGLSDLIGSQCDIPMFVGNSEGEYEVYEEYISSGKDKESINVAGFSSHAIVAAMRDKLGLSGSCVAIHNTCSSSNNAIELAVLDIRHGDADVVICGSSDPFSKKIQAGFNSLNAISKESCKPFDKDRDGIVVSEGAVMFILESLEHAQSRGAKVYAQIAGVGTSNDASHLTNPNPDGIKNAIEIALSDAQLSSQDIDVVFAHATGTLANDKAESAVFNEVFGDTMPKIIAGKGVTGHMMAVAGAANTLAACLSFESGKLPPTAANAVIDPSLNINLLKTKASTDRVKYVMCNSYGFGGNNGVVILKNKVKIIIMNNDKIALITGASKGIGAAIAKKLASQNVKVAINYNRSESGALLVKNEIEAFGG
ncbi:SDR family NAD(P)-dependent oxidoreductase [Pseudoalteromonas piscicida]|uniref:SDR family NAD(P)-dependent oxidoreductase n=1 Tax=Pseudoalteromonas piscicida TaxID=43662 RepID=UPI0016518E34|nr:SDR family NAD(P)-dependent oxidoreductase [Pseudoalteromonas piscicida]